jgi:hypothetical protein
MHPQRICNHNIIASEAVNIKAMSQFGSLFF